MSSTLVSLLPIPRQQFFSASGIPLAGGFVYTYLAGTSTPAATYLDYTGTSLNTNPITLDAGGFASIWIPAGPIDVAVFNSSMVQQYKVLGVTSLPSVVASLTAGYFQSSTVNPALSGTLRLASTDLLRGGTVEIVPMIFFRHRSVLRQCLHFQGRSNSAFTIFPQLPPRRIYSTWLDFRYTIIFADSRTLVQTTSARILGTFRSNLILPQEIIYSQMLAARWRSTTLLRS